MSEFQKIFNAYGGDYAATLSRFLGNEAMYLRFLDMFFQDENLRQLGDALEVGDLSRAFEAAHSLKGVTGNMGLTPLYETICAIVEPLRAGQQREDYSALYEAIQKEFHRVGLLREQLKGSGKS